MIQEKKLIYLSWMLLAVMILSGCGASSSKLPFIGKWKLVGSGTVDYVEFVANAHEKTPAGVMIFKDGDTQNWNLIDHSKTTTKNGPAEVWRINVSAMGFSGEVELTFLDKDKGNVMYVTMGGKDFQGKYICLKE